MQKENAQLNKHLLYIFVYTVTINGVKKIKYFYDKFISYKNRYVVSTSEA